MEISRKMSSTQPPGKYQWKYRTIKDKSDYPGNIEENIWTSRTYPTIQEISRAYLNNKDKSNYSEHIKENIKGKCQGHDKVWSVKTCKLDFGPGVSGNSRSRPFPGIPASHSRSQSLGMSFSFPFPFPKVGNAIFHSRSRSQNSGMQFSIPVPVSGNGL